MNQITDHLADIKQRVALAREHSSEPATPVTIVAVSKQQPLAAIRTALDAGQVHFGENYLQEALNKITALAADMRPCWHFIGKIQSNKTRAVAEHFDWVETVDRERIAERLHMQRPDELGPLDVLIQLNPDADPNKGGVSEGQLLPLAQAISRLSKLRLRGVMCIPEAGQSEAGLRQSFSRVAAQAALLRTHGFAIDTVSMGMSADFELAIECGATSVRIGTALFGARPAGN